MKLTYGITREDAEHTESLVQSITNYYESAGRPSVFKNEFNTAKAIYGGFKKNGGLTTRQINKLMFIKIQLRPRT